MLELDRVAKLYGVKVIFKEVSCAFTAGSVSLLVGGNGAGKSTLMRIMAGLSRPSAGRVRQAESGTRSGGLRLGYLGPPFSTPASRHWRIWLSGARPTACACPGPTC